MSRSRAGSRPPQPRSRSSSRPSTTHVRPGSTDLPDLPTESIASGRTAGGAGGAAKNRSRTSSFLGRFIYTPPGASPKKRNRHPRAQLLSLYKLLAVELNIPEFPQHTEGTEAPAVAESRRELSELNNSIEQIANLVKIPLHLEKFMMFGLLVCLNSFLTLFTLVPLKLAVVFYKMVANTVRSGTAWSSSSSSSSAAAAGSPDSRRPSTASGSSLYSWSSGSRSRASSKSRRGAPRHAPSANRRLLASVRKELYTIVLVAGAVCVLSLPYFDISRLYHDVRGSAHIKLYVMFGGLEVADKLFSAIGQDILTILYALPLDDWDSAPRLVTFAALAVGYLICHGYTLIYQAVALNVAANSYSNALLGLLLSNQFSELKSAVFKKFEREGLFQIAMADLTERFQLSLMLGVIALRNLVQVNSIHSGLVPSSWKSWNMWLGAMVGPSVVVIGSEIFVDWLKHCYITKFNKVRPRIYDNFLYVLSLDYLEVFQSRSTSARAAGGGHDPVAAAAGSSAASAASHSGGLTDYIVLARRIGLPLLATIVCFLRMALPDLKSIFFFNSAQTRYGVVFISLPLCILAYIALLLAKLILGMVILTWANRIRGKHYDYQRLLVEQSRAAHDAVAEETRETVFHVPAYVSPPAAATTATAAAAAAAPAPVSVTVKPAESAITSTFSSFSASESGDASPDSAAVASGFQGKLQITTPSPTLASPLTSPPAAPKQPPNDGVATPHDSPSSPSSPKSPIELSFLPGVPNTEMSSINPNTRSYLYDHGEKIPPTPEEKRNQQFANQDVEDTLDAGLGKVSRYEMSSKRIW